MFLEEHIDRLKQQFPNEDFRVPFTQGSEILKSIEKEFIVTKDLVKDLSNLRQYFSNWPENIKHKVEIKSIDINNLSSWLYDLDSNKNYWIVIPYGASKSLAYDCKPNALNALVTITQSDFFIIDKKYKWFSYFQIDQQTQYASIFRSGEELTPFDK